MFLCAVSHPWLSTRCDGNCPNMTRSSSVLSSAQANEPTSSSTTWTFGFGSASMARIRRRWSGAVALSSVVLTNARARPWYAGVHEAYAQETELRIDAITNTRQIIMCDTHVIWAQICWRARMGGPNPAWPNRDGKGHVVGRSMHDHAVLINKRSPDERHIFAISHDAHASTCRS